MKKNRWVLIAVIAVAISSCTKVNLTFGDTTSNDPNIVYIDTIGCNLSTFKADSFVTSNTGTMLLGQQSDSVFGVMDASSYFQLGTPGLGQVSNTSFVFLDSARFLLQPTGTFYGDTTGNFSFGIYQITDQVQLPFNQGSYYNTARFNTLSTPVVTYNTTISPFLKSQIRIPLPDPLANELFNKLKGDSNQIKDNTQFLAYKPGFYIKSLNTNKAVYSFSAADSSLMIRLYYHVNSPFPVASTADFKFINSNNQFNHITVNRQNLPDMSAFSASGSAFTKGFSSTLTGNKAFIQTAGGLQLKMDFPSLRSLRVESKYQKIMKATLIIRPYNFRFGGIYSLPTSLTLQTANDNNVPTGSVLNNLSGQPQTIAPVIDELYGINTSYTYDVTRYVSTVMNSNNLDFDGLTLESPAYGRNTSIDRFIITDKKINTGQYPSVQLQIYALTF